MAKVVTADESSSEVLEDYTEEEMQNGVLEIPDVLSRKQCEKLICRCEEIGFETLDTKKYDASQRNNKRLFLNDPKLAAVLFSRLLGHVPAILELGPHTKTLHSHRLLHGEWKLHGLDSRIRCYRYDQDNHFDRHEDYSDHVDPLRHRGMLTLMVYLNDVAEGGSTQFYVHNGQRFEIRLAVNAEAGKAAVFHQRLTHRGEPVKSPPKYCLRTNVLYKRVDPVPELRPEEAAAVEAFRQAQTIENEVEQIKALCAAAEKWKDVEMYVEGY